MIELKKEKYAAQPVKGNAAKRVSLSFTFTFKFSLLP